MIRGESERERERGNPIGPDIGRMIPGPKHTTAYPGRPGLPPAPASHPPFRLAPDLYESDAPPPQEVDLRRGIPIGERSIVRSVTLGAAADAERPARLDRCQREAGLK